MNQGQPSIRSSPRCRDAPATPAALVLAALLAACAPTPPQALPSPTEAATAAAPIAERSPHEPALQRMAALRLASCSGQPAHATPADARPAAVLDAELRHAMWRHCGAAAHGSRHACLHDLMLACG